MPRRILLLSLALLALGGCSMRYSLVGPGPVRVGGLTLEVDGQWNRAASLKTPYMRKDAEVWTRDGLLLDRLMIIPAVPDGEALFRSKEKDAALPVFHKGMLPNEVMELVESSIVKVLGEGDVAVSTSGLRPQRFGEHRGGLFEIHAELGDGPNYSGVAGGFVDNDQLYLVIFIAAEPYYFDKHRAAAEAVIGSARLL